MNQKIFQDISKALDLAHYIISRVDIDGAFVSFSQHGEDVLLNRVFSEKAFGRYIDIGANHPISKSVTYSFFLRGWEGISIDMDREMIDLYDKLRPNDIALQLAISDSTSHKQAFLIPGTTRSSLNQDVGLSYMGTSFCAKVQEIQCVTLMSVLEKYPQYFECDFLNIDVEGHEAGVLRGIDFKRFHPKVIVIEAIHPITRKTTFHEWDYILFEAGYTLALYDGLNAYFVVNEDMGLVKNLSLPPNYADNYIKDDLLLLAYALVGGKSANHTAENIKI
jgi:FkbM family methyltransferase